MRPRVELATLLHVDAIDRRRRHSTRYIAGGQHTQTPSPLHHQPPADANHAPRCMTIMTIIIDRNYILYVLPSPDLSIFHITHHRNISWSIFHTDSITLGLTDKESTGDLPSKDKHPSSLPGIYFFNYRKKNSPHSFLPSSL